MPAETPRLPLLALALSLSLLLSPSQAYPTQQTTADQPTDTQLPEAEHGRNLSHFSRDFATALAVASVAVAVGTTLICVFAHCWRQILDWGLRSRGKRRRPRKVEEAWFCGVDRPPRFVALAPEAETMPLSMAMAPGREGWAPADGVPAVYARNSSGVSRGAGAGGFDVPAPGMPFWPDVEEVERPASVAYFLDRP